LLGIFAGSAVILVAAGLFGVVVNMVRQRKREFGIRRPLGATLSDYIMRPSAASTNWET